MHERELRKHGAKHERELSMSERAKYVRERAKHEGNES